VRFFVTIFFKYVMPFSMNKKIESLLIEEPTVSYENVFNQEQLQELKKVALNFLEKDTSEFPTERAFWFRKGGIHRLEYIQDLAETYLKKFLPRDDVVLIGDTAFAINFPPHDIHIDCRDFRADINHKGIISYKSLVIPIEVGGPEVPTFYTANQYFYGPSTRLRAGSEETDANDKESQRQKEAGIQFIYDYQQAGVKYLSNIMLTKEWYDANIDAPTFTPHSNFKGISIEKEHAWKPGNILVFDSARIHFAQNILKRNAKYKIGISLNFGLRTNIDE